jgi:flagellar assembly protein FliH
MLIPKEELAGYERWELGSLGDARAQKKKTNGANTGNGVHGAKAGNSAVQELERITAQAQEAGRTAGYREGSVKAQQEAAKLHAIAVEAQKGLSQDGEQMASEVLELALELARQMVRTELKVRRETILAVVREAVDCLPHGTSGAQLILNPADVELVRTHIGDELKSNQCRLVEDHRIQPGGCRIASPVCEIDATLATRWKRIVATLGLDHNWLDTDS